jgi:uncharacterized protein (DUF433 family)
MSLLIEAEEPPLKQWDDGSIRVGGTRVKLEIVITAYNLGESAEEIAYSYPSVSVSHAYAVIAYYLRHKADVDAYVVTQERRGEELRQEIEAKFPPAISSRSAR